jgi:hypothetical protein
MSRRLRPPSPEQVRRLRELAERPLSPEEFRSWVEAPITDEERENEVQLIRWFNRRYPTPGARLAYARGAMKWWQAAMPPEE